MGGEAWYLAAKDEGHGFRKKQNRDFYLETVADVSREACQEVNRPESSRRNRSLAGRLRRSSEPLSSQPPGD